MVVEQGRHREESMNANGQDVLEPKLKTEGSAVVAERGAPPYSDRLIYRMVVAVLGAVLIIATVGALIIAMAGKGPIPEMVVALGSGAAGALAGLLAPSPAGRQ
jgi:hypothetical protein